MTRVIRRTAIDSPLVITNSVNQSLWSYRWCGYSSVGFSTGLLPVSSPPRSLTDSGWGVSLTFSSFKTNPFSSSGNTDTKVAKEWGKLSVR